MAMLHIVNNRSILKNPKPARELKVEDALLYLDQVKSRTQLQTVAIFFDCQREEFVIPPNALQLGILLIE
jgi:histone deacetylase complex regulatory component SIN3